MNLPNAFLKETPLKDRIRGVDVVSTTEYRFRCGSTQCQECYVLAKKHGSIWRAGCEVCGSETYLCGHGSTRLITMILASKIGIELIGTRDDAI